MRMRIMGTGMNTEIDIPTKRNMRELTVRAMKERIDKS